MKKSTIVLLILFTSFISVKAQVSAGLHLTATEYLGDLNPNEWDVFNFKSLRVGGGGSLRLYLNPSFDLVAMGTYNRLQYQTDDKSRGVAARFIVGNGMLKYKFDNGYILKENAVIAPFLLGGGGITHIRSYQYFNNRQGQLITEGETITNLAFGAGGRLRLSEMVSLEYAAIYNVPYFDGWDNQSTGRSDWYLQHSAGIVFALSKGTDTDKDGVPDRRDKCANTPTAVTVDKNGCPIDSDADGVADYQDKCPQVAGTAAMAGCPDTDGDGVPDNDDKCPAVAGLPRFNGCPDTDGDGVEDAQDKCPNTAAGTPVDASGCPMDSDGDKVPDNIDKCPNTPAGLTVDANGCPPDTDADGVPDHLDKCPNTAAGTPVNENGCPRDTDNDGIPDNVDRCPNTPGPGTANGCPVVKEEVKKRLRFATRGIFFETGKATLKPASFPKLDEVVDIINEYPDYNLRLGGHTDNVGSDASNLTLSQARVDAVKSYLSGKGAPETRLDATGYGEKKPIATNKTAAGRAQNRRVEMDLYLK